MLFQEESGFQVQMIPSQASTDMYDTMSERPAGEDTTPNEQWTEYDVLLRSKKEDISMLEE